MPQGWRGYLLRYQYNHVGDLNNSRATRIQGADYGSKVTGSHPLLYVYEITGVEALG